VGDDTLSDVMDGVASTSGALVKANHPWVDAQLAQLYDAFSFDADVPLYVELAAQQGGRVLELACGSGRLLVPLAEAGHEVAGIDVSTHMLALAGTKLERRAELRDRVHLVHGDMRGFDVPGPFDLAIIAVKSFAYLTDTDDQLRALSSISRHLRQGGLLAIDLLHATPEWIGQRPGSLRDDLVHYSAAHGFTLSRVESVVRTDLSRQIRVIRSAYEAIDERGQVVAKRFVEWSYRWIHRFEAEHLLARAGFELQAVYGGYQREPFTSDSPTMLMLARRQEKTA